MTEESDAIDLLAVTAEIVSAHVSGNSVQAAELPTLITSVHSALSGLGQTPADTDTVVEGPQRAVSIRKSLADPAKIISMIDGKAYTVLTRHLKTHNLTPQAYREKFDLPRDYPMIAAHYAERRREIAKTIGLGRKKVEEIAKKTTKAARKASTKIVEVVSTPAKAKRTRPPRKLSDAISNAKAHLAG